MACLPGDVRPPDCSRRALELFADVGGGGRPASSAAAGLPALVLHVVAARARASCRAGRALHRARRVVAA